MYINGCQQDFHHQYHSLGHQYAIIHRIIHLTNNDFTHLNLENLGLLPSAINSIFCTNCVQATFLYQLCRSEVLESSTLSIPTLSTSFSSFKISSSTARSPDRLTRASGFFHRQDGRLQNLNGSNGVKNNDLRKHGDINGLNDQLEHIHLEYSNN